MLVLLQATSAFVVPARPSPALRPSSALRPTLLARARPPALAEESFDVSSQQFDLLSLRTYRRDTILQYDATNQSEPLRIALTVLGLLFSLSIPSLANELHISDDLTANVGAVIGSAISGFFFVRNRAARSARMLKIEREYAAGDLRAVYRGVRTILLRELRGKKSVVAVVGSEDVVEQAVEQARAYRRRLTAAGAVVVPIVTDGASETSTMRGEAESQWLWAASDLAEWQRYFSELLDSRGMADRGDGMWLGLNSKGRSFGSALGSPRWDEMLGTALQPIGDGYGEMKEVATDVAAAAEEAAAASGGATTVQDAAGLLEAQDVFYQALTSGDTAALRELWAGAALDASVSEVVADGGRVEPWAEGSNALPPSGMRATDRDALLGSTTRVGEQVGWTTAIERPVEGGTLLATQRWSRSSSDGWRIQSHRYIPWSADGATAIAALRCDCRGCVLLGRNINTRAP